MSYPIEVLQRDKQHIDKCLKDFKKDEHKEAFARQAKKSKELQEAIELLTNK